MNAELKSLIEDAAKLLGLEIYAYELGTNIAILKTGDYEQRFNPLDPERSDLMKVAMAAGLSIEFDLGYVFSNTNKPDHFMFDPDDHNSLAIAVIRAASAVYRARNGNAE